MSRFPEVALVALLLTTFVSACGPTEDDPPTREPTATKLRLINESGGAIWYEEPGTCAQFSWLTLHDEGTKIATEYDACRFGARCSDITTETCSRVQCAPCLTDVEPKKLEAGERLTLDWAGWVWKESNRQNDCSCGERVAPKADSQLEAEFC